MKHASSQRSGRKKSLATIQLKYRRHCIEVLGKDHYEMASVDATVVLIIRREGYESFPVPVCRMRRDISSIGRHE